MRLKTRHSVRVSRLIEKRRGRRGKERRGKRRRGSDKGRKRGRRGREKRWDLHHILHNCPHVPSAAVFYFPLTLQELAVKRAVCVSRLPPEPEVGDPQAIHVMLRTPGGERLERRFSASDKLQVSCARNCGSFTD